MSYLQIPRRRLRPARGQMRSFIPHALSLDVDPTRLIEGSLPDVQAEVRMETRSRRYSPTSAADTRAEHRRGRSDLRMIGKDISCPPGAERPLRSYISSRKSNRIEVSLATAPVQTALGFPAMEVRTAFQTHSSPQLPCYVSPHSASLTRPSSANPEHTNEPKLCTQPSHTKCQSQTHEPETKSEFRAELPEIGNDRPGLIKRENDLTLPIIRVNCIRQSYIMVLLDSSIHHLYQNVPCFNLASLHLPPSPI